LAGTCVCCVKFSRNKRKRQPIGMLGRISGNHDWLFANASACVSCGFRLRNARNASDCVWMETGPETASVLCRSHLIAAYCLFWFSRQPSRNTPPSMNESCSFHSLIYYLLSTRDCTEDVPQTFHPLEILIFSTSQHISQQYYAACLQISNEIYTFREKNISLTLNVGMRDWYRRNRDQWRNILDWRPLDKLHKRPHTPEFTEEFINYYY